MGWVKIWNIGLALMTCVCHPWQHQPQSTTRHNQQWATGVFLKRKLIFANNEICLSKYYDIELLKTFSVFQAFVFCEQDKVVRLGITIKGFAVKILQRTKRICFPRAVPDLKNYLLYMLYIVIINHCLVHVMEGLKNCKKNRQADQNCWLLYFSPIANFSPH